MRKRILIVGMSVMLCMLCGCLQNTPLTDAEMDAVAEYAAMLLLSHDSNYESVLWYGEDLDTVGPENSDTENVQNNTQSNVQQPENSTGGPIPGLNDMSTNEQLTSIVAVENFSVTYEKFELKDAVVSNDYFTLSAKDGRQYAVVTFRLYNNTDSEQVFDASKNGLEYSIDINTGSVSKVSMSMLQNDLQYMPITVPAKGTAEAVLVFEIAKTDIKTAHLIIESRYNDCVIIKMQ